MMQKSLQKEKAAVRGFSAYFLQKCFVFKNDPAPDTRMTSFTIYIVYCTVSESDKNLFLFDPYLRYTICPYFPPYSCDYVVGTTSTHNR